MRESQALCGYGLPRPINRPPDSTSCPYNQDKESALRHISEIILSALAEKEHEVGYSDQFEGDEYADNYYCYDEDGWCVDLAYRLCGRWVVDDGDRWTPSDQYLTKVWVTVDELEIHYCNDETGEEIEFNDDELTGLRVGIIKTVADSVPLY